MQPPGTEYRASGTYTYVGVDGDLLSNPTSWDINGGGAGGATFHSPFSRENLTDTSFSYSGIDIEINFDPSSPNEDKFICGLPPCIFNLMEWSSSAENVQIVASIPESVTIDIKPGSDPNSINLRSKGVIPVAILSTNTAVCEALAKEYNGDASLSTLPGTYHCIQLNK